MEKETVKTSAKAALAQKQEASHEVAKMSEFDLSNQAWGAKADSSDITIPKILLMQALSEFVDEGSASVGQFVGSLEQNLIADKGGSFECIVFGMEKYLLTFVDAKFSGMKPYAGELFTFEEHTDLGLVNNYVSFNFYVLLTKDIAKKEVFPYALSFSKTALKVGKTLATHIKKLEMLNKPSAAKVFVMGTKKESNDKGSWYLPTVELGRVASSAELSTAHTWWKALQSKKVQVDNSDLEKHVEDVLNPTSRSEKHTEELDV